MAIHLHSPRVTPGPAGQVPAGSTVHDLQPVRVKGLSTSSPSRGDVDGAHHVSVGFQSTGATEKPSALGLGHLGLAPRAGRTRPPFVDQFDDDARQLGLVREGRDRLSGPPVGHGQVLASPGVVLVSRPLGSPIARVPMPAATANSITARAASWLPWATRRRWRSSSRLVVARYLRQRREPVWPFCRSPPCHSPGPGLLLGQVQAVLRSDGPARHHQRGACTGDGEGMDDPEVHAGHPLRVGFGAFVHRRRPVTSASHLQSLGPELSRVTDRTEDSS